MNQKLKHKYEVFRRWQKKPHKVAPLKNDEIECLTCFNFAVCNKSSQ